MPKSISSYVCQSCGSVSSKWAGQCGACGVWDSIVEEAPASGFTRAEKKSKGNAIDFEGLGGEMHTESRRKTGIAELDRVLGGGLVPGSAVLIGGDPGIGKSTLLLQAVAAIGGNGAA